MTDARTCFVAILYRRVADLMDVDGWPIALVAIVGGTGKSVSPKLHRLLVDVEPFVDQATPERIAEFRTNFQQHGFTYHGCDNEVEKIR